MNHPLKNKAWQEMSAILDREMPIKRPVWRVGIIWLLPLALICTGLYFAWYNSVNKDNQQPKSSDKNVIIASKEANYPEPIGITENNNYGIESIKIKHSKDVVAESVPSHIDKKIVSNLSANSIKNQGSFSTNIKKNPSPESLSDSRFILNDNPQNPVNSETKAVLRESGTSAGSPDSSEFITPDIPMLVENDTKEQNISDNLLQTHPAIDHGEEVHLLKSVNEASSDNTTEIDFINPVTVECCRPKKWKIFTETGAGTEDAISYSAGISYQWLRKKSWTFNSHVAVALINMNVRSSINSKNIPESGLSNNSQDIFTLDNNNIPYLDIQITRSKELRLGLVLDKSLNQKFYVSGGFETVFRSTTVDLSPLRNGTVVSSQNYSIGQEISDLSRNKWDVRPSLGIGYHFSSRISLESRLSAGLMPVTKYLLNPSDRYFIRLLSLRLSYNL